MKVEVHQTTPSTPKKGVSDKNLQPGRPENSFIDQGEFVAMKTLSGRKARSVL